MCAVARFAGFDLFVDEPRVYTRGFMLVTRYAGSNALAGWRKEIKAARLRSKIRVHLLKLLSKLFKRRFQRLDFLSQSGHLFF